jgi:hypothetical protein
MSTLPSKTNGYGTVFACTGCGMYSTSLVGKQIDGMWYCSTCPPQSAAVLLDRAVDVMSALHRAIEPDLDHPEIPGIVPAAAMRAFVDALADIDRARCKLRPSSETLLGGCLSYWRHHENRCVRPRGHTGECYYITPGRAIMENIDFKPPLPLVTDRMQGVDCPDCEDGTPHTHAQKAKVGETLTPETSPLSEKCPKCSKHMFNWPGNLTKCVKCQHEWYMDSSTKGKL